MSWYKEVNNEMGVSCEYHGTDVKLFSEKSPFQLVEVFESSHWGRILVNDGFVMCTEKDEFVYHEMIAHVPLFLHPNPKRVLVVGGGDGGTAREVLRHKSIERCVMVEIDRAVVDAAKEYLPTMSSSFSDPRLELIIDDGIKYMKDSNEQFDVILVDSTDPIGPATPLFNKVFYEDVWSRLKNDGLVVSQCESPFSSLPMQKKVLSILSDLFASVGLYSYHNMGYPGPFWSFSIGSKKSLKMNQVSDQRIQDSGLKFQYYNKGIHQGSFALPQFYYEHVKGFLK